MTNKMSFFSKFTYMRVSYVEPVSRASTTGTQETTGPLDYWTPGLRTTRIQDDWTTRPKTQQTTNPALV